MKLLVAGLLVSSLIAPRLAFGQQTNEPLTRAQVREQIVEIEKAGYTALESNTPSGTYLLHSLSPIVPDDQCPSHDWRVKRIHRSKTQWPQVQIG